MSISLMRSTDKAQYILATAYGNRISPPRKIRWGLGDNVNGKDWSIPIRKAQARAQGQAGPRQGQILKPRSPH